MLRLQIPIQLVKIIESFLKNRSFSVRVKEVHSTQYAIYYMEKSIGDRQVVLLQRWDVRWSELLDILYQ